MAGVSIAESEAFLTEGVLGWKELGKIVDEKGGISLVFPSKLEKEERDNKRITQLTSILSGSNPHLRGQGWPQVGRLVPP